LTGVLQAKKPPLFAELVAVTFLMVCYNGSLARSA
jgi:hypothetical protein